MKPKTASLALAALLVLAGGCATLYGLNPPRVNVSSVTPADMTLLEQKFLVQVRVQNPNDVDLEVKGMTFDLDLNGKSFATGLSGQAVVIPRFGSNLVEVEMISGITGVVRQIAGMAGSGAAPARFTWRLQGKLYLERPVSTSIGFDESGEIEIAGLAK